MVSTKKTENKVAFKLFQLLCILKDYCPNVQKKSESVVISANSKELCSLNKDCISAVLPEVFEKVVINPGELLDEDDYVSSEIQENFLKEISLAGKILRLNHIGFCYPVVSINLEKEKILKMAKEKGLFLYEIPANDFAEWLFIGDLTDWRDPMIEIMPIEGKIVDKEIGWWLPHIQVAVDTNLSFEEIKKACGKVFKGARRVVPISYEGFVTQVRIWQGVISGVNIHLDLATSATNSRYVRKVMMTKLAA